MAENDKIKAILRLCEEIKKKTWILENLLSILECKDEDDNEDITNGT